MNHTADLRRPAEAERDEYRARVLATLARDSEPLSDLAALVADVFADVSQLTMCAPFGPHAIDSFDIAAEELGTQSPKRAELLAAFAELRARDLMPSWVTAPSERGTR